MDINTKDDYERGLYTFTVTDDGIGMSDAFVSHIFDYFEREILNDSNIIDVC